MTIVLCSKGYPGKYKKNIKINNIKKLNSQKDFVYHAGTKLKSSFYGGRVLNITSCGNNFKK